MATASAPILVTEFAAAKVKQLIEKEERGPLMLRVFIQGGGCSGFQYGFDFAEAANEDDMVVEKDGMQVLIDPLSFQYLDGVELDYKEDLQGARFVINNPNATTTCSCGASFGV